MVVPLRVSKQMPHSSVEEEEVVVVRLGGVVRRGAGGGERAVGGGWVSRGCNDVTALSRATACDGSCR
jgi:hypothetical protein